MDNPPPATRASHWRSSNAIYDYDFAPRVAHYYENGDLVSYCGTLPWPGTDIRPARRKCLLCCWYLFLDGKARLILPR